jgi:hypothetical protein
MLIPSHPEFRPVVETISRQRGRSELEKGLSAGRYESVQMDFRTGPLLANCR